MSDVIKFPKEVSHLKYALRQAENNRERIKFKDEVITYAKYLNEDDIMYLLGSFFNEREFESLIMVNDELIKKKITSLKIDLYVLLSYIGVSDIFQARNYLMHSPSLKQYKHLYIEAGANYSKILGLKDPYLYKNALTFVIASLVVEMANEVIDEIEDIKLYHFARFIDLINVMQELGYEDRDLSKLISAIDILFEIKL